MSLTTARTGTEGGMVRYAWAFMHAAFDFNGVDFSKVVLLS